MRQRVSVGVGKAVVGNRHRVQPPFYSRLDIFPDGASAVGKVGMRMIIAVNLHSDIIANAARTVKRNADNKLKEIS